MATLTTKFSLGDKVWRIWRTAESIKLPCRLCRGSSRLSAQGANDETRSVKCPECGGNATVTLGSWPEWKVQPTPLELGMISLKVCATGADNGAHGDNMNPARAERVGGTDEENYMAWSTGVGSGSIYHVEDLFATRDAAEAEADARTERARAGEAVGGRKDRWVQWWPSAEQVIVAAGFLDHRDIYEHTAAHLALAQAIVEVGAKHEASR